MPFIPTPAPGLGYGGAEYGYSPYGSGGTPRQPWPVSRGYGGAPYGTASYGSADVVAPQVSSATSVDGNTVELFFSEAMVIDGILLDPASYTLTPTLGAPSTISAVEVGLTEGAGATSVILTHSGTTLGGSYGVQVVGMVTDLVGNPILPSGRNASFLALGTTPSFAATPESGSAVRLDFSETMLTEAEFSPGVEAVAAYGVETSYPVPLIVTSVTHPHQADASKVLLTVTGMTSAEYRLTVSPATAVAYDGTYLPDTATTFTGVEVGTGSSSIGAGGLLLTKAAVDTYGWDFQDTSGKVLPASTVRLDVGINVPAAVVAPGLYDAVFGTLTFSDGAVQVAISLTRVAGIDVLEVTSGAYFAQVPAAWSAGPATVSLVRNQKAGLYTVLFDGVPLTSAAVGGLAGVPSILPGVRVQISATYAVTQLPISAVSITASQTVFTGSWNFLHGVNLVFIGSSALARPSLLTKRGPLVKAWGDPTPATVQDVEVRVNGVAVTLATVNPYIGLVTPTVPIPLTAVGTTAVEVDYAWFPNPILPLVGLNTLGLVLNKWNAPKGHHPPVAAPLPASSYGVQDTQRFQMGVVLPPLVRRRPVLLGHRYIGFERGYTAALNSPTTLLLNQNPYRVARSTLQASPEGVEVSYEGDTTPVAADLPWSPQGTDTGYVGTNGDAGFYFLVDATTGAYGTGEGAYYVRDADLSFPATVRVASRVQVQEWVPDGVFTGVALGLHDNRHLFLVGFLEVNGVKHVGLLKNALRPDLVESWTLGPSVPITITSSTTFTTASSVFTDAALHGGGLRFQVTTGAQAGVYEVAECGVAVDGATATVTITGTFPANHTRYGNRDATAYVEVSWHEAPVTVQIVAHTPSGAAEVRLGGAVAGVALSASKVPAFPAQTILLLPTTQEGAIFWGSLSRPAMNTSKWGFLRYGVAYDRTTYHFQGIVVAAEMSTLPDEDQNHEWFVTEDFGYAEIDSTGDTLLLKSTTASPDAVLDTTFGYGRVEPFLTNQVLVDVDAKFRVDSGILGAGDAQVQVQNGERRALLATVLYAEGGSPFRQLVTLPVVAITALRDPSFDGWGSTSTGDVTVTPREGLLIVEQGAGGAIRFEQTLTLDAYCGTGRIIEGRFAVVSGATFALGEGPYFGGRLGPDGRDVGVQLLSSPARVQVISGGAAVGAAVAVSWDDGAQHTYRVEADPVTGQVVLLVDDLAVVVTTTAALSIIGADGLGYFGTAGATTTCTVEWSSFSVTPLPALVLKRTLGVLRAGGDPSSIDSWEIPRTDAFRVPNSDPSAVIEEMDWRAQVRLRLRLDPGWGVTVFRPDLPPPPYYDGEFATQYTEPSAGWINVEYRHLPRLSGAGRFGRVEFGALDPRSITQQRWGEVRYRVYTRGDESFIAPQNMVLNRSNVITSGELLQDTGAEVLAVESISTTLISLAPTHIYAARVFSVMVDAVVLDPTSWTFDPDTQAITLVTPLPAAHTLVTVTFAAGKPVTNTYLCSQPLLQSTTLLNEGTPPVPMSQTGSAVREVVFGSALNDPTDTLGDVDFILNDPFRTVQFTDDAAVLYEHLDFCTVDDGNETGLISTVCDGMGWVEIALSGTSFTDGFSRPGGPARWGGSNVAQDSVGGFSQASILHVSGGSYVGASLGPSSAVLWPSYPSVPGPDRGATARSFTMRMRLSSVLTDGNDPVVETPLEDDINFDGVATDSNPPSSADPGEDPNPDGTGPVNGNGACAAESLDYAGAAAASRLGPWGGLASLGTSLLGGGAPLTGDEMLLRGGAVLPQPTSSAFQIEAAN